MEKNSLKPKMKQDVDEEGYITVRRKKYPRKKTMSSDCSKEDEGITGAEPSLCTLWINKVTQGNVFLIKKYLNKRNIRVQKVTKTSHLESKFKSFKISILRTDKNYVMKDNFWPEGVRCRPWKERNNSLYKSGTCSNSCMKESHLADCLSRADF